MVPNCKKLFLHLQTMARVKSTFALRQLEQSTVEFAHPEKERESGETHLRLGHC
jgi:hypothetical protein